MSQGENSGRFVNYYLVQVDHPQRTEQVAYQAECEDIIDALELTPDEANIFKEIWRTARQRQGTGKAGNTPLRAAEKYVHYSNRLLRKAQREVVKAVTLTKEERMHQPPVNGDTECPWEIVNLDETFTYPNGLVSGNLVRVYTLDGRMIDGKVRAFNWGRHEGSATITHFIRLNSDA